MNNEDLNKYLGDKLNRWDEPLPPSVEGRLRAARRTALSSKSSSMAKMFLLPAMSLVCMAIVAMVVLRSQSPSLPMAPVDDMYMLTSGDDFELYDDVEFLLWLGEQGDAALG